MTEYNTDNVEFKFFKPHGRVNLSVIEERIVLYRAFGPFNIELFQALEEIVPNAIKETTKYDNNWCELVTFEHSCMATMEVIDKLRIYVGDFCRKGLAPLASAYVIPNEVEGASLMKGIYEKCYRDAGLEFSAFNKQEDAIRWIKTYI